MALGMGAGPQARLREGDALLAQGRWRMAEEAYRDVLLDRPRAPLARVGLARALAALSECEEALELLDSVRGTAAWRVSASMTEGRCLEQEGRTSEALEVYRYATERVPEATEAWLALARASAAAGLDRDVETALDTLRQKEGGVPLESVVRAEWALRRGEPEVEGWLWLAERQLGPNPVLALVDARAWLDHGDPLQAERALLDQLRRTPGHSGLLTWRSEALRRLGRLDEARELQGREELEELGADPLGLAFRARSAVDGGELDRAAALLERIPDPVTPEALASRWYLARARGEAEEATRLATLWRSCERSSWRVLEQLIPVDADADEMEPE